MFAVVAVAGVLSFLIAVAVALAVVALAVVADVAAVVSHHHSEVGHRPQHCPLPHRCP